MAACLRPLLQAVGIVGAPIGLALQRWVSVLVLVAGLQLTGSHKRTWFGWSLRDAFDWPGMKTFLKLGLPSCIGLLAEMLG